MVVRVRNVFVCFVFAVFFSSLFFYERLHNYQRGHRLLPSGVCLELFKDDSHKRVVLGVCDSERHACSGVLSCLSCSPGLLLAFLLTAVPHTPILSPVCFSVLSTLSHTPIHLFSSNHSKNTSLSSTCTRRCIIKRDWRYM